MSKLTFLVSGSTSGTLSTGPGTCVPNATAPCEQWPFIVPVGLTALLLWLYIGWDSRRPNDLVFKAESPLQACPWLPEEALWTWFILAGNVPFLRRFPVDDRLMKGYKMTIKVVCRYYVELNLTKYSRKQADHLDGHLKV